MNKRRFLFLVLLVAIVQGWTVGHAVAQKNPMPSKRAQAWIALHQALPDRMKGDPVFQRYMDIYNARERALSNGDLIPKQNAQGTRQLPQQVNPGGPK